MLAPLSKSFKHKTLIDEIKVSKINDEINQRSNCSSMKNVENLANLKLKLRINFYFKI